MFFDKCLRKAFKMIEAAKNKSFARRGGVFLNEKGGVLRAFFVFPYQKVW